MRSVPVVIQRDDHWADDGILGVSQRIIIEFLFQFLVIQKDGYRADDGGDLGVPDPPSFAR